MTYYMNPTDGHPGAVEPVALTVKQVHNNLAHLEAHPEQYTRKQAAAIREAYAEIQAAQSTDNTTEETTAK